MRVENKVIDLFITVILVAALIPVALTQIFGANTSEWDASSVALWGIIGIIVVIAVVLAIFKIVR